MIDSMTDGIIVLNRRNRIIRANLAAKRVLGKGANGTIINQPIEAILSQVTNQLDQNAVGAAHSSEIVLESDGQQRHYDCRLTPLGRQSGLFKGRLIVLRDVTESRQISQSLRSQKELFESLVAVARATTEKPTLASTLQNTLDVAAQLTGAESGSLILVDRQQAVTQSIVGLGQIELADKERLVSRVMTKGLAGWVAENQELALVGDTNQDERWLPSLDNSYDARSALAVPIVSSTRLLGVLTLTHSEPDRFTQEHVHLLQSAADQVSLAVRNAQMYDEMLHYANDLNTLYTVTQAVGRSLELEDVLSQTLALVLDSLHFEAGLISVAESSLVGDPDQLRLIAHMGISQPILTKLQETGLDQTLSQLAQKQRQAAFISDIRDEEAAALKAEVPRTIATMTELGMRAGICIPLLHQERSVGTLCMFSRSPRSFSNDDLALHAAVGQQIATAVTNARLFRAAVDERSQLQALIESSRDGIILVSKEEKVLIINPQALSILRLYGRPQIWNSRTFKTIVEQFGRHSPAAAKSLASEMERSLQDYRSTGSGEFEMSGRYLHWLNLPVKTGEEPLGRLLILRDVTEERTLERMRDDLIHTTVHDLRNPLTGIFSALEFLEHDMATRAELASAGGEGGTVNGQQANGDRRQLIQITRTNARQMLKLVNTILDINRLEAGHIPLKCEAISVQELINDVLDSQLALALEKGIELTQDVPADVRQAWADRSLIDRVLQNLIGNSIKFTPSGGKVQVIVQQVGTEKQWLQFSVVDSGAGIPIQIQPRLFQQFTTGGQKERGSGLGLAFCRMAIKAHDELIWAENKPEGGAVFHFTLPIAPVQSWA